jgi:hypothetical protein
MVNWSKIHSWQWNNSHKLQNRYSCSIPPTRRENVLRHHRSARAGHRLLAPDYVIIISTCQKFSTKDKNEHKLPEVHNYDAPLSRRYPTHPYSHNPITRGTDLYIFFRTHSPTINQPTFCLNIDHDYWGEISPPPSPGLQCLRASYLSM